jgi:hypothetical protein
MNDIFPAPGLIGLTQISGSVGAGIRLGQFLNGDGFSLFEHAFVSLGNGQILEAEPGGARIVPLHYRPASVYWCEHIYDLLGSKPATPGWTDTVVKLGATYKGIKYSFLDYDALVAHRLHLPIPGLEHFIADTGHMICSQIADDFYLKLGVEVFTDKRWTGFVTPGSLWKRDLELAKVG